MYNWDLHQTSWAMKEQYLTISLFLWGMGLFSHLWPSSAYMLWLANSICRICVCVCVCVCEREREGGGWWWQVWILWQVAHIWNEWHSGGPLGGSQRLHAGVLNCLSLLESSLSQHAFPSAHYSLFCLFALCCLRSYLHPVAEAVPESCWLGGNLSFEAKNKVTYFNCAQKLLVNKFHI